MIRLMGSNRHLLVDPDTFQVSREPAMLVADIHSALAVCLHDDSQAVGGILHLRYVASHEGQPLDLTDNTLSSGLLLMDRFCRELRSAGARRQCWLVGIYGHMPGTPDLDESAATVVDLAHAYFAEARRPVHCEVFRRSAAIRVQLDAREGRRWVSGTPHSPARESGSTGAMPGRARGL